MINVLFFGLLRDVVGMRQETCEMPATATLGGVFDAYAIRFPRLSELRRSIVVARNHQFCDPGAPVSDGDEIAFLPPVSGGSGVFSREFTDGHGNFFALTPDPIETTSLLSRTPQQTDGAVVVFDCRVRDTNLGRPVRCLEYECDEAEAIRSLARLGAELAEAHEISRITIVHRLGNVPVGEARVVIVVAAAHRKPAFAVAMEAMDRLKTDVPIRKREHFADAHGWFEKPSGDALPASCGIKTYSS